MLLCPRFMAIQYLVLLQYNKLMEVLHTPRVDSKTNQQLNRNY